MKNRDVIKVFKYKVLGKVNFGNEINDILKLNGVDDINSFLNPNKNNIESETLFDNIDKGRKVFVKHIDNKSKISIVVDSDVDGYTSASLMYQYIKRIDNSIEIEYIIHNGKEHGIEDLLDEIIQSKCNLLIVPDAGSSDVTEIEYISKHNIDVIILDHHICTRGEPYTSNYPAVVINNQMSSNITDKAMTGVGIVYKFIKHIDNYYNLNYADDYLDVVCLGMIADRCNMFNLQSRYLIYKGLKQIQNGINVNLFIKTLIDAQSYSLGDEITVNGIGFYIAPLMNALIRLGEYEEKQYMFEALCNSDRTLMRKVRGQGEIELPIQEYVLKSCQHYNRQQKKLAEQSVIELEKDIIDFKLNELPVIVCNAKDKVDTNSTGLIANKLASKYQKPCLLLRRKNNYCSGSGRGFDKCNIVDFNKWCKDTGLFKSVQGHNNAFGCSISYEKTNDLFKLLQSMSSNSDIIYHVYNVYNDKTLDSQIIKNIAKYKYVWGCGVDEPLFLIQNIVINKYNVNLLGLKQNRLEFMFRNIKFIMFAKSGSLSELYHKIITTGENINFTIVGTFGLDTYNGGKTPLVTIEDIVFEKSNENVGFIF